MVSHWTVVVFTLWCCVRLHIGFKVLLAVSFRTRENKLLRNFKVLMPNFDVKKE